MVSSNTHTQREGGRRSLPEFVNFNSSTILSIVASQIISEEKTPPAVVP
jgi:hypothetical protein